MRMEERIRVNFQKSQTCLRFLVDLVTFDRCFESANEEKYYTHFFESSWTPHPLIAHLTSSCSSEFRKKTSRNCFRSDRVVRGNLYRATSGRYYRNTIELSRRAINFMIFHKDLAIKLHEKNRLFSFQLSVNNFTSALQRSGRPLPV